MAFERSQDALDWAKIKGLVKICHIHNIIHDHGIECPQCVKEKHLRIFENVIWPDVKSEEKEENNRKS